MSSSRALNPIMFPVACDDYSAVHESMRNKIIRKKTISFLRFAKERDSD